MKKVVLVTNSLMVGGLCSVIVEQAHAFIRAGHEVHIVLLNKRGSLPESMPCSVHNLKMNDSSAFFLYRILYSIFRPFMRGIGNLFLAKKNARRFEAFLEKEIGGDLLVILHGFRTVVTLHRVKKPVPIMTMHEMQSDFVGDGTEWVKKIRKALIRRCFSGGELVAVSNSVKSDFEMCFGAGRSVSVIHNGIDSRRTRLLSQDKNPFLDSKPYIVTIGRLVPVKAVDVLIKAYAVSFVRRTHDLIIVGDGPEKRRLELLVYKLGLGGSVHFAGYMKQPFHVLKDADLYVGCSVKEGFGLALLEALCLGVPVLSSGEGGFAEIMEGQEAFFFSHSNVSSLTQKLDWFFSGYEYHRSLQFFPESFDLDVTVRQYLEFSNES